MGPQAGVEMHERAVEERIAFGQHHDILTAFGQRAQGCGDVFVEGGKGFGVAGITERNLGGDRVVHRVFGHVIAQHPLDDAPRLSRFARLAEIGDVAGVAHQTVGAHAHQIGRAGAKADAVNRTSTHSLRLAMALIAATVIAEPPRRPCTMQQGTG